MEQISSLQLLLLFLFAIPIGMYAILFGGALFLALPLFQILFPGAYLGSLVGTIKVGSVFRNAMALYGGKELLTFSFNKTAKIALPLIIGTIIGSLGIVSLPQIFIIPILVLAIVVSEASNALVNMIPHSVYLLFSLLTGFYIGIFGAGSIISLVTLVQLKNTENKNIAQVRMEALLLEFLLAVLAVTIFFFVGSINLTVAIAWTAGSLIGGYLGGKVIKHTGKFSAKTQKLFLRITFAVALLIALWTTFAR